MTEHYSHVAGSDKLVAAGQIVRLVFAKPAEDRATTPSGGSGGGSTADKKKAAGGAAA